MTRGAQGGEAFMASRRPWDGCQAACRFGRSAVGSLVIWGPKGFHLINRKSTPRNCIFSLFLPHLAVTEHCFLGFPFSSVPLMISRPVHLGDYSLAFLLVASFCQVCSLFLPLHLRLPVSLIFLGFFGVCLRLRGRDDVWGFSMGWEITLLVLLEGECIGLCKGVCIILLF